MTPSRTLYLLVAAGVVPFLLSFWWPPARDLGTVYDVILLLLLVADFRLTQRPNFIQARRSAADRFSIGRSNPVNIEVENEGAFPLKCRLRDDSPRGISSDTREFQFILEPSSSVSLRYQLTPTERGRYQFGDLHIRYMSFLGLFWRHLRIPAEDEVKVFSDLQALHDLSVKLSHSSELGEMHQRRRGQGTDFASLREYAVGDDVRAIDWNATARRDRPVVRTYEAEQEQVLLILIDAGRMMVSELDGLTRFEHALNAALSLALTGLVKNDQVGIGIFANKPLLYLPPRRGKTQLKRFLEAVFDIKPQMVEPDYVGVLSYFASAQKARSLMVVLTDLTDPVGSQTLLTGLASLSPRHLPFCVTLKDRQVDKVAADRNHSIEALYRRAVAVDLQQQRELALSVLVRRGCQILDCPPQELSTKLVNRYLEIKSRARL